MIYFGIVEERLNDPMKLGRVKVRIAGLHTADKSQLPTEDLPWAIVMQPSNSSAMSGIGFSPTGLVEGTCVVIVFRDEFNQNPVVIGTVPGIPTEKTYSGTVSSGANTNSTTGNSEQVNEVSEQEYPKEELKPEFSRATSFSTSEHGLAEIRQSEGLASTSKEKRKIGSSSLPDDTKIYSYQDTKGIWTIGYGNTYLLDNSKVTADTQLTHVECKVLMMNKIKKEFEPVVRKTIRVPITQSMFDACVSMAYNMGPTGFSSCDLIPLLNAGQYEAVAAKIPLTKNNNGTLTSRREREKTLFLKDGIPQVEGTVKKIETEQTVVVEDKTQNPVVILNKQPETDLSNSRPLPIVPGFSDPNNVFPKIVNEPDTHRLARGEHIDGTVVYSKESARVKGVRTASGTVWNQPPVPYNAKYPYNHVYATEGGHIQEFDDSPGAERIHTYHKSGTYSEIDRNGTRINRIVGDGFEIFERNSNVFIRGSCNITVSGDANIRVENNTTIETLGSMTAKVGGDFNIGVNGNFRVSTGGEISLDGTNVHLNSGKGGGVPRTGESAQGLAEFAPLEGTSRFTEQIMTYETPDETDGAEDHINEMISQGKIDETDPGVKAEEVIPEAKPYVETDSVSCDLIFQNDKPFTPAYQLSKNFTLGKITSNSKSGIPTGINYGMTDKEIICNLKKITVKCLEPIAAKYPNVFVSSAWRSEAHNKAVGGSDKSDHLFGCALDLQFTGFKKEDYYKAIQEIYKILPSFQQLLLEYKGDTTWIHISYNEKKGNIKQAMTLVTNPSTGKVTSSSGFTLIA